MSATRSRPLSPHLQVYRLPLSAILSILHRLTGIALFLGSVVWVWWLLGAAIGDEAFASAQWFIGSWLGQIILLGCTWSMFHHLGNGIRHLFWDIGKGYELETAHATGWAVVVFGVGMTLIAWIAGYIIWLA